MNASRPNRRDLLSLTAASAVTAAGGRALAGPTGLDLAGPSGRLRAYMLMRGALDERLVIGWATGRYYGVVGSEVTPLYGFVAATFAKFRARPDGGYSGASYEIPYFTDLETGEALTRFTNPYTHEEVAVPQGSAFPPARLEISPQLELSFPKPPPGLTLENRVLPPKIISDNVWMVEQTFSSMSLPGASQPVRYAEIVTLHARRSDLEAPGAKRAPCDNGFESIVSWRPWLKMGERPGHLNGNGFGQYGVAIDEMPGNWLDAVRTRRPEVLSDPGGPLDAMTKD